MHLPGDPDRVRDRYERWKLVTYGLMIAGVVALWLARRWFRASAVGDRLLPTLALLGSLVFAVAGCMLYARIKGRSPWLGFLGLMNVVGYIILIYMKKCCHRCGALSPDSIDDCPSCGAPI